MSDLTSAIDQQAAQIVFSQAITELDIPTQQASGKLGPFGYEASASANISGGVLDLIPPSNTIRVDNCILKYRLKLNLILDLSIFNICLPKVCVDLPLVPKVCTPGACLKFPKIPVPISHSGEIEFGIDFRLNTEQVHDKWRVNATLIDIPTLDFSPEATAIVRLITNAVGKAVGNVPGVGPVLSTVTSAITDAFSVTGFVEILAKILTPFVSGITVKVFEHSQVLTIIKEEDGQADVKVKIESVNAVLQDTDGDEEMVVSVDISPVF